MALLGIIRRWHLRDQVPLREIAKRLGISRNTVRRYLRSETTEPAYAERQSASAIDPYAFQLSGWLKTEASKSRKQRRTLKQLHEDLTELGFKGSYDRVAAFARQWREGQTEWVNSARKRTCASYAQRFDAEGIVYVICSRVCSRAVAVDGGVSQVPVLVPSKASIRVIGAYRSKLVFRIKVIESDDTGVGLRGQEGCREYRQNMSFHVQSKFIKKTFHRRKVTT